MNLEEEVKRLNEQVDELNKRVRMHIAKCKLFEYALERRTKKHKHKLKEFFN